MIVVEKYGGTSVADVERISAVAENVASSASDGSKIVVVVSAMGGQTDRLMDLALAIDPSPPARELDVVLTTGEQVTIGLLVMALRKNGVEARSFTGGQAGILTNSGFGKARIEDIDCTEMKKCLDSGCIAVLAGFQGVDENGMITSLGRGGSDTTAVAMAAALGARECRIYTDVDGVYTADPRIVPDARRLDRITGEEMLEFASLGAKVLMSRSVEFASRYRVPLRVLSSFEPGPGTRIEFEEDLSMEQPSVSGITHDLSEGKVTIRGVPDRPGIASRIFGTISDADISVDMIVQNIGADGMTDITFTCNRQDITKTMGLLEPVIKELEADSAVADNAIAKISAVGVGMRSHAGIASTMFRALADEGISIQMISTSEIKVSVVVEDKYAELAVRTLHAAFNLDQEKGG